ncbi:phosphatidylserine decarboxylase-domain-containing protein [Aspergillus karnatakaensis]|uniref:phosphatidylserine decarboxylase n=1 Tax=Aspergillus karnatakaensis TaxID=1810916 RepID=UPI003CCD4C97
MTPSKDNTLEKPITYPPKHPIVRDLVDFINRRTPIYNTKETRDYPLPIKVDRLFLFNWAIADAVAGGEQEMKAECIEDLDGYLKFLDHLVEWTPTVSSTGDEVLRKILVFYWPFNQQALSDLQTPIAPRFTNTDLRWLSYWLVAFARRVGDNIQGADSVFNGQWDIEDGSVHIDPADVKSAEVTVDIKGITWPIKDLVRSISEDTVYDNGSFTHAFLGPTDYHRQHAPVEGKVIETKNIQEQVYLQVAQSTTKDGKTTIYPERGVVISPQEQQRRSVNTSNLEKKTNSESQMKLLARYKETNHLEKNQSEQPAANGPKPDAGITAPDHAGYQWCQTRGLIVIDTSYDSKGNKKSTDNGLVAVLPMGMAQVSSVVLTVKEGQFLEKGQNISYFQFGGSDIVTVFQKRPTYRSDLQAGQTKLHIREKVAEWK